MPRLDARVASVLDSKGANIGSDDEDGLIAALEDDEDRELGNLREKRLQQLHEEFSRAKQLRNSESGHGLYLELKGEKEVMDVTTSVKLCIVHFFKSDFNRCRIMDKHLTTLAPIHLDTRFLKMNVENAPFLVAKLKVQVLPCVLAFKEGISTDRIIGFEGLGNGTDSFTTIQLEARLVRSGVLLRPRLANNAALASSRSHNEAIASSREGDDNYDDDEWD